MKINNIVLLILFAMIPLVSCDQNDIAKKLDRGYEVKDGYIKFKSINDYKVLYELLSNSSVEELNIWNSTIGFKTLEVKYREDGIERYIMNAPINDESDIVLNTSRLHTALASMFNDDGILLIGDTILKVKDDYIFEIQNGDFELVDSINKDINFSSDIVIKQNHTLLLAPTVFNNQNEKQNVISDRTLMFYTSENTREAVRFDAFLSGGFINFEMNGRYQKKSWLGWILSESSPMVYGRVNAAGSCGGAPISTSYPFEYDKSVIGIGFFVGLYDPLPFDLNVTYNYKKTDQTAYINEWQGDLNSTAGTLIKNYEYRQF